MSVQTARCYIGVLMPNLRVVALSVQLLAIGTVAGASVGETFNFPSERFDSIQAAIDVAVDGDEVVVAAGHHYQKIDFRGKRIRVRSSDGPLLTTIETPCWTSDHLVRAASGETRETVLEGFRVIERCSDVPAIAITNSGLTVRNCAVQSNGHGAIQARGGYATALLENCHFSGTVYHQSPASTAMAVVSITSESGELDLVNCVFERCEGIGWGMYSVALSIGPGCSGNCIGCVFLNNQAPSNGGAGSVVRASGVSLVIVDSLFDLNVDSLGNYWLGSTGGTGVAIWSTCPTTILRSVFRRNIGGGTTCATDCSGQLPTAVSSVGGAIRFDGAHSRRVEDCWFIGNRCGEPVPNIDAPRGGGGAIAITGSGITELVRCRFDRCSATHGGAIYYTDTALKISQCSFVGCSADQGSVIHRKVGGTGTLLLDQSILTANTGNAVSWIGGGYTVTGKDNNNFSSAFLCPSDYDFDGVLDSEELLVGTLEDCNSNGVSDLCDTAAGASDSDYDGRLDVCECDLNHDQAITGADIAIVLGDWGASGEADFDDTGIVDGADLVMLLNLWGAQY